MPSAPDPRANTDWVASLSPWPTDGFGLERIRELLLAARDLWRALPELEDESEQRIVGRTTFRLVHLADILAVTTRD